MANFCLGTAQLGMNYGVANTYGQPKQDEINNIISTCFSNGIEYLDTAQSYGNSENTIGNAIQSHKVLKEMKIVSKYCSESNVINKKSILSSVIGSLNRLKVDSIYALLAHRYELINNDIFIDAMLELKKDGLIEKFGVSVYSPHEARHVIDLNNVDILQIPFNIIDKRWINEHIFQDSKKNNIQLFYRSIFLQGLFFLNSQQLIELNMAWAIPYIKKVKILVKSTKLDIKELSFKILSEISTNNVIIFGVDNSKQLADNIRQLDRLQNTKIDIENWWEQVPNFPDKLLNPTLWN